MKQAPQFLECTLRDGSYVIDFQFTGVDTRRIASRLHALGFPLIEVGHGIGLGASKKGYGTAACDDQAYMAAVADQMPASRWGMFAIPGIADVAQIETAADYGMGFVRVGCEVGDAASARPLIEAARRHGIYVFSNLLKSYAAPVEAFVKAARKCISYGAQCVYIVDSAGGMLAPEILRYADALRQVEPEAKLGFHGHNNLGLGVANALACADAGFDVIDTSLQGMGRSGGNVPTEQMVCALIRAGYDVPHDPVAVMQAGEELIRPLIRSSGLSSLDVTAGFAQFHSSYMPRVLEVAKKRRVDPRRLMIALCERDRLNAPMALIEECAAKVQAGTSLILAPSYHGQEQT